MDNIDTLITTKKESSNVLIYIFIIIVIIGIFWLASMNSSERFSNNENNLVLRSEPTNQQMTSEDVDEMVRRHAIASHQVQMVEQSRSNIQEEPENSNVPLLRQRSVKPFKSNDLYNQDSNYDNGDYYNLTADDRTIALMNQVDRKQGNYDVACNLSNNLTTEDKAMVSDYKNKYYNMYAHQINCASGNGGLSGCGKKCYANGMSPSRCTTQECKKSMNELNNNADFVSLNQLILEKNNAKPCSTCTQGPIQSRAVGVQNILDQVTNLDNVSASFMDSQVTSQTGKHVKGMRENFEEMSNELKSKDRELSKKKKVSFANVNNFANFNNYVNQNGVLETSVDKLAEIRSDVTNNATCGLNQYGQSISQVYDNLMSNPYMEYKKSCDVSKITGIMEDNVNDFQGNGNFGGNYSGDFAHV
jgi:hypothetical protein